MIWQIVQKDVSATPTPCSRRCSFGGVQDVAHVPAGATCKGSVSEEDRPRSDSMISTDAGNVSSVCSTESLSDPSTLVTEPLRYTKRELLSLRHGLDPEASPCPLQICNRASWSRHATPPPNMSNRQPNSVQLNSPTAQAARHRAGTPEASRLPPASPNSWALVQQQRRQRDAGLLADATGCDGLATIDEELNRRVKSILNKLTPEKFATLYMQLVQCGINEAVHIEMLARTIFNEAVVQHKFSGMYADLCACLISDLGEYDNGKILKDAILTHCMQFLDSPDQASQIRRPAEDVEKLEVDEELRALRKKQAIGVVHFMGELLIRNVFDLQLLPELATSLLKQPLVDHNLEQLATLLTVVGPIVDTPMWPLHSDLVPVFWQVHGLTFDPSIPKRVRCLLRDVIDLRDAQWIDTTGKQQKDRPMMLEEVRYGLSHDVGPPESAALPVHPYLEVASASASWNLGGSMDFVPILAEHMTLDVLQGSPSALDFYHEPPASFFSDKDDISVRWAGHCFGA